MKNLSNKKLFDAISLLLDEARGKLVQSVNQTMVSSYWEIGRLIVEDEQMGSERAEYGKKVMEQLSTQLTLDFGKGFDITNIRRMRAFYQSFPIRDSVSLELSWTHYRYLLRVSDEKATSNKR